MEVSKAIHGISGAFEEVSKAFLEDYIENHSRSLQGFCVLESYLGISECFRSIFMTFQGGS